MFLRIILLMDREERAAINSSAGNTSSHNSALRLATAFSKGTRTLPRDVKTLGCMWLFTLFIIGFYRDSGHRPPAASSVGPPALVFRPVGFIRTASRAVGPALHLWPPHVWGQNLVPQSGFIKATLFCSAVGLQWCDYVSRSCSCCSGGIVSG